MGTGNRHGRDGKQTIDYANPAMRPAWIGYLIYLVVGMRVTIAISVNRFHDRGKSGWWGSLCSFR